MAKNDNRRNIGENYEPPFDAAGYRPGPAKMKRISGEGAGITGGGHRQMKGSHGGTEHLSPKSKNRVNDENVIVSHETESTHGDPSDGIQSEVGHNWPDSPHNDGASGEFITGYDYTGPAHEPTLESWDPNSIGRMLGEEYNLQDIFNQYASTRRSVNAQEFKNVCRANGFDYPLTEDMFRKLIENNKQFMFTEHFDGVHRFYISESEMGMGLAGEGEGKPLDPDDHPITGHNFHMDKHYAYPPKARELDHSEKPFNINDPAELDPSKAPSADGLGWGADEIGGEGEGWCGNGMGGEGEGWGLDEMPPAEGDGWGADTDNEHESGMGDGVGNGGWGFGVEKRDPKSAYEYARDQRKDRWPEGEPSIITSPEYAYLYAKDVLRGRWEEAENYIKQDPHFWELYRNDVLRGEPLYGDDDGVGNGGWGFGGNKGKAEGGCSCANGGKCKCPPFCKCKKAEGSCGRGSCGGMASCGSGKKDPVAERVERKLTKFFSEARSIIRENAKYGRRIIGAKLNESWDANAGYCRISSEKQKIGQALNMLKKRYPGFNPLFENTQEVMKSGYMVDKGEGKKTDEGGKEPSMSDFKEVASKGLNNRSPKNNLTGKPKEYPK